MRAKIKQIKKTTQEEANYKYRFVIELEKTGEERNIKLSAKHLNYLFKSYKLPQNVKEGLIINVSKVIKNNQEMFYIYDYVKT